MPRPNFQSGKTYNILYVSTGIKKNSKMSLPFRDFAKWLKTGLKKVLTSDLRRAKLADDG